MCAASAACGAVLGGWRAASDKLLSELLLLTPPRNPPGEEPGLAGELRPDAGLESGMGESPVAIVEIGVRTRERTNSGADGMSTVASSGTTTGAGGTGREKAGLEPLARRPL